MICTECKLSWDPPRGVANRGFPQCPACAAREVVHNLCVRRLADWLSAQRGSDVTEAQDEYLATKILLRGAAASVRGCGLECGEWRCGGVEGHLCEDCWRAAGLAGCPACTTRAAGHQEAVEDISRLLVDHGLTDAAKLMHTLYGLPVAEKP